MNINDVNSWSKFISWQSATPPSRPDSWQIDICRIALRNKPKSCKIAVLGSTIEYRDLLAELGFGKVYVFDRNKNFYDYITPFSKQMLNEAFIDGNWLETLKTFNCAFDAVLSDLTSGNIPYPYREKFYKDISSSLVADGMFIDRILTMPISLMNLRELIEKYTMTDITRETVNSFNCEVLFCSTLLKNKEQVVDSSHFYDYLLALKIPRISDFVKACYAITPRDCVWWYSKPWDTEKITYEKYFHINEVYDEPTKSEYLGRAKLFISTKSGYR